MTGNRDEGSCAQLSTLFDKGYMRITSKHEFTASRSRRAESESSKSDGGKEVRLPAPTEDRPGLQFPRSPKDVVTCPELAATDAERLPGQVQSRRLDHGVATRQAVTRESMPRVNGEGRNAEVDR